MLTQVYDGDRLVGLADATQTPSDPPLTKFEKEVLRLWREHQQQAEQIAALKDKIASIRKTYDDRTIEQAEQTTNLEDEIEQKCESLEDADEVIQRLKHDRLDSDRGLQLALAEITELKTEYEKQVKRLKSLCQDAIDEINPHNPMAKKEMDRIIKELAAQPQGGDSDE